MAGKVRAEEALLWEPAACVRSHAKCTGFEFPKSEFKAGSTGSASSVPGTVRSARQDPLIRASAYRGEASTLPVAAA